MCCLSPPVFEGSPCPTCDVTLSRGHVGLAEPFSRLSARSCLLSTAMWVSPRVCVQAMHALKWECPKRTGSRGLASSALFSLQFFLFHTKVSQKLLFSVFLRDVHRLRSSLPLGKHPCARLMLVVDGGELVPRGNVIFLRFLPSHIRCGPDSVSRRP